MQLLRLPRVTGTPGKLIRYHYFSSNTISTTTRRRFVNACCPITSYIYDSCPVLKNSRYFRRSFLRRTITRPLAGSRYVAFSTSTSASTTKAVLNPQYNDEGTPLTVQISPQAAKVTPPFSHILLCSACPGNSCWLCNAIHGFCYLAEYCFFFHTPC
jgi:hypothetical protein